MIKITDTPDIFKLTSIKKFDCPNCKIEIVFRVNSQVMCYKCGKPLVDVSSLLKTLTTRILYHSDCLIP